MIKKRCLILILCLLLVASAFPVSSFAAWTDVWDGSVADGIDGGSGTEADPYRISSASQLAYLSQFVRNGGRTYGYYFELRANIDLNGFSWQPIGTYEHPFYGHFDGNGYTVRNLYIYSPTANYIGLFGYASSARIESVLLHNIFIRGNEKVGALVGYNGSGTIYACSVNGKVYGNEGVGGIAGEGLDTISRCYNCATVTGTSRNVGGISGSCTSAQVFECVNEGSVISAGGTYVGGICGFGGNVYDCFNRGDVTGADAVSGIATYPDSVVNCGNTGKIQSNGQAGGISGRIVEATVTNCFNAGIVTGGNYEVGGIAGYADSSRFTDCYNLSGTATELIGKKTYSSSSNITNNVVTVFSMDTQEFTDMINESIDPNLYTYWSWDSWINDGYPYLAMGYRFDSSGQWALYWDGCYCVGIMDYYGDQTDIEIPIFLDGYIVTGIGNVAFYENGMSSVSIPGTVYTIGSYAFYGCNNLTDVYFTGSRIEWSRLDIQDGNEPLTSATLHTVAPIPEIYAEADTNQIVVSWDEYYDVTHCMLYRRANETGSWGEWTLLGTFETTSYTDTNVVLGGKYQYRLRAYSGEWSGYSDRVEVTMPLPEPPAAPSISVTPGDGKNTVSWAAVPDATSYTVYRRANETGSWSSWVTVSTQTKTQYEDTAVTAGCNYEYRVKASGLGGTSEYSNRVTITALAPQPPAAPAITIVADAEKVTVNWNIVEGAAKYQVFRREKAGGKWSSWTLVFSAKPNKFTDTGVTGGVVYEYRVKSVKMLYDGSSLKSGYSNREMIGLQRPDSPVITVTAATGANNVKWNTVAGGNYYVVYWRDKASGEWSTWNQSDPVTELSFVHSGVTSGVEYQYRVRASNGVWSDYSNKKSVIAK